MAGQRCACLHRLLIYLPWQLAVRCCKVSTIMQHYYKHPVIDSTGKVAGEVETDVSECSQIVHMFFQSVGVLHFPCVPSNEQDFP